MRRPTLTSTEKIAMTQADADQSHAPKDGADYDSTHEVAHPAPRAAQEAQHRTFLLGGDSERGAGVPGGGGDQVFERLRIQRDLELAQAALGVSESALDDLARHGRRVELPCQAAVRRVETIDAPVGGSAAAPGAAPCVQRRDRLPQRP